MPTMPPGGGDQVWPEPPRHSRRRRWIIVGVSFAAVVALVVGMLVWQSGSSGDAGAPSADGVDRTVGLLTEKDPACDDWIRYANDLGDHTQSWSEAEQSVPAAKWTLQQRVVFYNAAEAMTTAADRFQSLLPNATHLVIQELAAQTVVFLRTYAERVPNYVQADSLVSGAAFNFINAVVHMCSTSLRAQAFSQNAEYWASTTEEPSALRALVDHTDPFCSEFARISEENDLLLSGWLATADSSVSAEQWDPQERALFNSVREVLSRSQPKYQEIAQAVEGRAVGDVLRTFVAYRQAFITKMPSYEPADADLWTVASSISAGLSAACGSR